MSSGWASIRPAPVIRFTEENVTFMTTEQKLIIIPRVCSEMTTEPFGVPKTLQLSHNQATFNDQHQPIIFCT